MGYLPGGRHCQSAEAKEEHLQQKSSAWAAGELHKRASPAAQQGDDAALEMSASRPNSFMYRFFPPGSAEIQVNTYTAAKFSEEEIQAQQEWHEIAVVTDELAVFEPAMHLLYV